MQILNIAIDLYILVGFAIMACFAVMGVIVLVSGLINDE